MSVSVNYALWRAVWGFTGFIWYVWEYGVYDSICVNMGITLDVLLIHDEHRMNIISCSYIRTHIAYTDFVRIYEFDITYTEHV